MGQGMGQVDKERLIFFRFDELDRLFGLTACDRVLIGRAFDDLLIAHEWHVVMRDLGVVIRILDHFGAIVRPANFVHVV